MITIQTSRIIKGAGILHEECGSVFQIIEGNEYYESSFVMRTSSDKHPLVSLENGFLWGGYLNQYVFKFICSKQQVKIEE